MEKFDGKKWLFYVVVAMCSVWLLTCASSCNTVKLDSKRIAKIAHRNPQIIAKQCFKDYPCTTSKTDTIRDSIDNVIFIECDSVFIHDSLVEFVPVLKKVTVPSVTKTVTITVKDSAENFLFRRTIDSLSRKLIEAEIKEKAYLATIDNQQGKISQKNKENWAWRIGIALLVGLFIWRKAKGSTQSLIR